jgi:hypothetical protein
MLHSKLFDGGVALGTAGTVYLARLYSLSLEAAQPDLGGLATPQQQADFLQWALKEGGLFVVVIVILYFYRRDFGRAAQNQQAQTSALLQVVQTNVTALNSLQGTTARLARAVEDGNRDGEGQAGRVQRRRRDRERGGGGAAQE